MDRKAQRDHARSHVNPKLRRNLRLFLAIGIILLAAVIFESVRYHASVWQVILALIVGTLLGVIFARMNKISWDDNAQHVTSSIDVYGIGVLVLYAVFSIFRTNVIHVFTNSPAIPALSLAILAGTMYGRVIGNGRSVVKILQEQEVFSRAHKH